MKEVFISVVCCLRNTIEDQYRRILFYFCSPLFSSFPFVFVTTTTTTTTLTNPLDQQHSQTFSTDQHSTNNTFRPESICGRLPFRLQAADRAHSGLHQPPLRVVRGDFHHQMGIRKPPNESFTVLLRLFFFSLLLLLLLYRLQWHTRPLHLILLLVFVVVVFVVVVVVVFKFAGVEVRGQAPL
jgi:hypothetical protein